jgi:hypothetical protein
MSVNVPDEPIYPPAHKTTNLDDLVRAKRTRPLQSMEELVADTFSSDEELDEFIKYTYEARRANVE